MQCVFSLLEAPREDGRRRCAAPLLHDTCDFSGLMVHRLF
ncbi:hypothetical protein SJ05684_b45550 (plasmid) [Sinorhizobium sojae CCBAU 05684]|uniref:Uncharacterized protein n=1 Tax=Sinorhizobium sojae CCBAU 05684 TaxID=716928 RepID=A0A249PIG7_9HYPH|nr:hypothetical protein SJ05684_b45550 [Sinorhizobium sojae CCBAU 05684]